MIAAPRPNVRRPDPFDASQRIRPVEAFEHSMREPDMPSGPDWCRIWGWGLALTVCATCWGLLLWMFI